MIAVNLPRSKPVLIADQGVDRGVPFAVAARDVVGHHHLPVAHAHCTLTRYRYATTLRRVAPADDYDGFLIDLDGVVWVGRDLIPGAAEALRELVGAQAAISSSSPTTPGRPADVYAARLREAGVDVGAGADRHRRRIDGAGWRPSRRAQGAGAFVIGAEALHRRGRRRRASRCSRARRRVEADVVVVSGHRGFDYEELLTATLALQGGRELVATSRDPTLPMPGGAWPGTGAILAAVETASGASAEIGGKPERHLFDLARERLGDAGRVAMVGDRVASDIEGGRRAGLETILVLSGATTREEADAAARAAADHVIDDLAGLIAAMSAEEGRRAPIARPGLAFAGIFAVTFAGIVAVGAVLPILPRYVHGPLDGGNIAVGVVIGSYAVTGLLLRPVAGRLADSRGRRPTVLAGSLLVAASGLPLPAPARDPRPDPGAARARRRRGDRLHRRLGLDRRHRSSPPPRPRDRPLRARDLDRAQRRAADRRAAAAGLRLHRRLALRRHRAAGRGGDRAPPPGPVPARPPRRGASR